MSAPLTVKASAWVWAALLGLLALTVGAAYVPLGPWNVVVALLIAIAKALLVAVFFMHLRWTSPLSRIFAGAGVLWLMIMLAFTLSDVVARARGTVPGPPERQHAVRERAQ